MRVAIDSGGTFTDCVYLVEGSLEMRKVLSTPHDPGAAILSVIEAIRGELSPKSIRHGTTVGTNAMLERRGARVAFVTTAGFEDTIAIGRQARASLYNWFAPAVPCIIPPSLRFGVRERTTLQGEILEGPSDAELAQLRTQVAASGAEAIALSLLFSFANSGNERLVAEALADLGLPISVSSEILPEFREFERASTLCANAYLAPTVSGYLHSLDDALAATYPAAQFHVMQSSGGIVTAETAAREPVRTLLSGPAGGVIGAWRVGLLAGFEKIITFDMGGTSTDVSLLDASAGGMQTTNEAVVAGMPIAVPMLDIHTVGAGGGSIARRDAGGLLHVGPESAGASPGPICYGQGEQPTVTDANLLLGRLDTEQFLDGAMLLDEQRTREFAARSCIGSESVEEFASNIVVLAEASMEKAIRVISIERGYDPREFTLLSFGGAGPLHACALARSLSIPRVLVPRMPGALSAVGILLADAVRDYSKTVMLPYHAATLEWHLDELEARARSESATSGSDSVITRSVDLRYVGQGYELNIPMGDDTLERFHELHRKRYGFADAAGRVEAVNVRVRMTTVDEAIEFPTQACVTGDGSHACTGRRRVYFGGMIGVMNETPVYARAHLRAGDRFKGPALITEYSSTTLVWPQDEVDVDRYLNLIIRVGPSISDDRASDAETGSAVDLAIYRSATHSIAEEMGAALRRTAFSPNIKERRDYSCAIFDGKGQALAMGDHMPVHLGSMPMSVRAAIDAVSFGAGDIAILNDPYLGGTHLPDITMIIPIFAAGEDRPIFYAAARAHHADVGGMYPGSMGLCREIYQEGLRIPPVKIVRGGEINDEVLQLILYNVRTPEEREGDLRAQIGACRVGEKRLSELVERFQLSRIKKLSDELLDYSERLTRAALAEMPEGTFTGEDFLDGDGVTEARIRIAVSIHINPEAGTAHVDFAGSHAQVASSLNAVQAITYSCLSYVIRCLLPKDAPATAGLMRPITLALPSRSIVDAERPAPVAGGNVETSQRIVDVLLRALAEAVPERIPAASAGTMSNLTIGGIDSRHGSPFAYYETVAGGMGARPGADGIAGVHTHMTNSLNTPVEALEYAYPLRVLRYSYRAGSGGKGKFQGGDGLIREIELLADAQITLLADRRKLPPYGLQGGAPGATGRALLTHDAKTRELPGKCSIHAKRGDVLRIETPGGGGWGIAE